MELVIKNKILDVSIEQVLNDVRLETHNLFYDKIVNKGNNLIVTCPFHKGGKELHPSCSVLNTTEDTKVPLGWHHCFTCGVSLPLPDVIGKCFNKDEDFGNNWLLDHYDSILVQKKEFLPEIVLKKEKVKKKTLDTSILNNYRFYHDYMWERKLTKKVVDKFDVGYDPVRQMITFPTYDVNDNLVMVTARSVNTKLFHIDKDIEKPLYLLNYVLKNNFSSVIITEAQIDALTAWSYGYPCIATIGSPSEKQIATLNKSGIRTFITMFDNDDAGVAFTRKFNSLIRKDVFVYNIKFDTNIKDINDMSKEQFFKVLENNGIHGSLNSELNKIEF